MHKQKHLDLTFWLLAVSNCNVRGFMDIFKHINVNSTVNEKILCLWFGSRPTL